MNEIEVLPAGDIIPADSQEIFPTPCIRQAIENVVDLVGVGMTNGENPSQDKMVWEATKEVLNRKFGKPRETIELTRKVKLQIDVPGWSDRIITPSTE
jgi:hypothetical protein